MKSVISKLRETIVLAVYQIIYDVCAFSLNFQTLTMSFQIPMLTGPVWLSATFNPSRVVQRRDAFSGYQIAEADDWVGPHKFGLKKTMLTIVLFLFFRWF